MSDVSALLGMYDPSAEQKAEDALSGGPAPIQHRAPKQAEGAAASSSSTGLDYALAQADPGAIAASQIAMGQPGAGVPAASAAPSSGAGGGPSSPTGLGSSGGLPSTSYTNANNIVAAALAGVGLGGMAAWATTTLDTLIGQGMDASSAENYILTELNNPKDANGQIDQHALATFNAAFPGFNQRIANGYDNGAPGDTNPLAALAAYMNYSTQIESMGVQAGLTQGTISKDLIGNAWSRDVSTSEMSARITQGYEAAASAPTEVQQYLHDYYGVTTGDLAAYYLNPDNTLKKLQENFNTASVGAAANVSGFDKALSQSSAQSLAAFLASSNSSGLAGGSVNEAQATNAFTSGLGDGLASAAQMAQAGFEHAMPGEASNSPAQVTQQQLIGGIEGDANAIAALRLATGTRTAATSGGGGFASGQGGVTGVGYGQQ